LRLAFFTDQDTQRAGHRVNLDAAHSEPGVGSSLEQA
jgi:hypothetical protein